MLRSARSHSDRNVGQELDTVAALKRIGSLSYQLPREDVDGHKRKQDSEGWPEVQAYFRQNTGSRDSHLEDSGCLDVGSSWWVLRGHLIHRGRLRVGCGRV